MSVDARAVEKAAKERAEREEKNRHERERFARENKLYEAALAEYRAHRELEFTRSLADDADSAARQGKTEEYKRLSSRAVERYQALIKSFPGTLAAADAQELLDGKEPPTRLRPPLPTPPAPPTILPEPTPDQVKGKDDSTASWVSVELPGADPSGPAGPPSSWKIVLGDDPANAISVRDVRPNSTGDGTYDILLADDDVRRITQDRPGAVWSLDTGVGAPKTVFVHGYVRRDGTYVRAHFRSAPGSKGAGRSSSGHSAGGRGGHR